MIKINPFLLIGLDTDKLLTAVCSLIVAIGSAAAAKHLSQKADTAKAMKDEADALKSKTDTEINYTSFLKKQRDELAVEVENQEMEIKKLKNLVNQLEGIVVDREKEIRKRDIRITFLENHQAKF